MLSRIQRWIGVGSFERNSGTLVNQPVLESCNNGSRWGEPDEQA